MIEGLEEKIRKIIEDESAVEAVREWQEQICGLDVPPFNYRYDHVFEAAQIAKYLARKTSANYDVAVLGAWMHDIAGPRTWKNYNHWELGAERARGMLLDEGMDSDSTERICDAIESHGGYTAEKPLENLENQIVWEADKLTKVGITAAIRGILNIVRFEPNSKMSDVLERLQEYLIVSRQIADSIFTAPGKKIAESRYQNLATLVKMLEEEVNLE